MKVTSIRTIPFSLPFSRSWRALSGNSSHRRGTFLLIETDTGICGRAEIVCWPGFGAGEEQTKSDMGRAVISLPGQTLSWPLTAALDRVLDGFCPEVRSGLEMGILDAVGQAKDQGVSQVLTGDCGPLPPVVTCRLFVHSPGAEAGRELEVGEQLKIKAKPTVEQTIEEIEKVRARWGEKATLTVDANQGWSRGDWEENSSRLESFSNLFVEEPCKRWWEGPLSPVKIAADESLHADTAAVVLDRTDLGALTIKPGLIGGFKPISELMQVARQRQMTVFFSSSLGTALERARTLHYAVAFEKHPIVGLGPDLEDQRIAESLRKGDLWAVVPKSPGLGLRTPGFNLGNARTGSRGNLRESDDETVLISGGIKINQASWRNRVMAESKMLHDMGIRAREIVIVAGFEPEDFALKWDALRRLGAVCAPFGSTTHDELGAWVDSTGASWMLTPDSTSRTKGIHEHEDALFEPYKWARWETRALVQTSGTTGPPGTQPVTQDQLLFSALTSALRLEHKRDDRWLLALPLHRIGGLSILERRATYGTSIVVPASLSGKDILEALHEHSCTHISLVPTLLERLLDSLEEDSLPATLRVVLVGGGAMSVNLRKRALEAGIPLYATWGMTESASQVCTEKAGPSTENHADVSMRPLSLMEVREDNGELIIEGPQVGGMHRTGDRGTVSDDGQVTVSGRLDDVIITGGVNVAPQAIEDAIRGHEEVHDAAAFGVSDATWGEKVVALVKPHRAPDASGQLEQDLKGWCKLQLTAPQRPKEIHFVEISLRNDMGKIPRKRLRNWFLEERRRGA